MIKINLLSERKPTKAKSSAAGLGTGGLGGSQSALLVAILVVGVGVAGGWWWSLAKTESHWRTEIEKADAELARLKEARQKGEEFEAQKDLLARKIELITNLKKQQRVPVHILDQVSRNLPEFLWLDSMAAKNNAVNISGKATTYAAVANFHSNLEESGYFLDVALGRTFQVKEGVAFSLSCQFSTPAIDADERVGG